MCSTRGHPAQTSAAICAVSSTDPWGVGKSEQSKYSLGEGAAGAADNVEHYFRAAKFGLGTET